MLLCASQLSYTVILSVKLDCVQYDFCWYKATREKPTLPEQEEADS